MIDNDNRLRLRYSLAALILQIIISISVKFFYPKDVTTSADIFIFNPTIIFSVAFIIISAILAYNVNRSLGSIFNGLFIGISTLLIFVPMALLTYVDGFPFQTGISHLLSYVFFHSCS